MSRKYWSLVNFQKNKKTDPKPTSESLDFDCNLLILSDRYTQQHSSNDGGGYDNGSKTVMPSTHYIWFG